MSQSFSSSSTKQQNTGAIGEMKDEYGTMDSSGSSYTIKNFQLENGQVLQEAEVCTHNNDNNNNTE